jgi:IS30 family transposase
VKTLTVNSSKEFADHRGIYPTIGTQTRFADQYCSWQRGSNENFNGFLDQYIPKKQSMETVTDEELTMIEKNCIDGTESGWNSRHPTRCFITR